MACILLLNSDGSMVQWENTASMSGIAPGGRLVTEGGEALPLASKLRQTLACQRGDILGAGTGDNGSDSFP